MLICQREESGSSFKCQGGRKGVQREVQATTMCEHISILLMCSMVCHPGITFSSIPPNSQPNILNHASTPHRDPHRDVRFPAAEGGLAGGAKPRGGAPRGRAPRGPGAPGGILFLMSNPAFAPPGGAPVGNFGGPRGAAGGGPRGTPRAAVLY